MANGYKPIANTLMDGQFRLVHSIATARIAAPAAADKEMKQLQI